MYIKVLLAASILVILFVESDARFGSLPWRKPQKRNCRWGLWRGTYCEWRGGDEYSIHQTRYKIPEKNGGKPCKSTDSSRYIPCKFAEYMGYKFMRTITETSFPGGAGVARTLHQPKPGEKPKVVSRDPCAEDRKYKDKLVMVGKRCENPRAKRSVRTKRQEPKTLNHRDVLLLVDESGSIGKDNFDKEMAFVEAIVLSLCGSISIGNDTTRIGIMTFDQYVNDFLDFDRHFKRTDIINTIQDIDYTREGFGSTCILEALNYTLTSKFIPSKGSRVGKPNIESLIIMITDGCVNCKREKDEELVEKLEKMSLKLERSDISVVTFLIGSNDRCMRLMSALADGSHCYQVFNAPNWDELEDMTKSIRNADCMDVWEIGDTC